MKRTTIWLGALALMVGGFAACSGNDDGGGDALSLEDYFTRLEEAAAEFQSRGEELSAELDERGAEAGDDIEAAIEIFREFFADATGVFEDFVDSIDDLNPPDEAAEAHDTAVESGRETVESLEQLTSDLEDAETEEEFVEVLDASADPTTNFTDACLDLQAIAVDNDIDVDLQCEGSIGG